ncbi:MAG: GNAT family N-acetyltransferase [Ruminococcaceae bacterium]|nr:GNAT family N-acetyltransferase [Oscillospiraceae bacterium]
MLELKPYCEANKAAMVTRIAQFFGFHAALRDADHAPDLHAAEETLAEWLLPPSKLYRIVADGVDAGFLRLCFRGGNVAWIEDIFVDPACRGRGYATAAIEEAERIVAADPRYTAVCLDVVPRNQAALHLYHKLGYDRLSLITVRKELRGDRRDRAVRLFEHDFSY